MKENVVEVFCSTHNLREVFMSWFKDEGYQNFEDWVYNYVDEVGEIEFDDELTYDFVISLIEE